MAAFVAAILIEVGDRTPWLAAILGDRFEKRGAVIVATLLALAVGNGIAGVGGGIVAAHLTPNARALLLSLALLSAGLGAFGRLKTPDRLTKWRIGAFATSFLGIAILPRANISRATARTESAAASCAFARRSSRPSGAVSRATGSAARIDAHTARAPAGST